MKAVFDRQKILADDPVYTEYDLSSCDEESIYKLFTSGSIDAYCPSCERKSIFRIQNPYSYPTEPKEKVLTKFGLIEVKAKCIRTSDKGPSDSCDHDFYIIYRRYSGRFTKIGQYPSRAILDFGELDEAFKELGKNGRKEIGTSVGLYAHGVGIGSFVYLRRVFESLVEEVHIQAKDDDNDWDDNIYKSLKMVDKIKKLKNHLPSRLVKSAHLYSILSKGIHELSEEECLQTYPLVKQAIQLILKQRHEEKEYESVLNQMSDTSK